MSMFFKPLISTRVFRWLNEGTQKCCSSFSINNQEFNKMFVLTDGAYPQFNRFVKLQKFALLPEEKKVNEWQSASQKDIERAFGILQGHRGSTSCGCLCCFLIGFMFPVVLGDEF
jgi:Plant transposon protein